MKTNIINYLLIIFLIIYCIFLINPGLRAEELNDSSISVVLAIDSSGSMKKTDPKMMRRSATRLFIDLLTSGDQVGIIEFSSSIKVLSDLTTIQSTKDFETLKNSLNSLSNGGDTRIDLALEKALEMLKGSKSQNKTIILLSDGALDVDGSPTSEKSKQALEKIFQSTLKDISNENIKIYTITLSDKSASGESKELQELLMTKLATDTNGFYTVAPTAFDIHDKFIQIIKDLLDPPMLSFSKEGEYFYFNIDSTIRRVNILVDKTDAPSIKLTIISPDSQFTKSKENELTWTKSDDREIITLVDKPKVGKWKIYSSDNIDKVNIEIFSDSNYKLSGVKIEGKKQASKKVSLSTQLFTRNSEKLAFKEIKLPENTQLFVKITTPDNSEAIIPLTHYRNKSYSASYIPPMAGSYSVQAFTKGNIERQSNSVNFDIGPEPLNEPKIVLDQSVYALGEKIKVTVIKKDDRIKFPEDFLNVSVIDNKSSKASFSLNPKFKKNKIYSTFKLNENHKTGEYHFTVGYYDSKGDLQEKEAIAYVIGKVDIITNKIDFKTLNSEGISKSKLTVKSELKLTTLPLALEVSEVELNSEQIKVSDLRFYYNSEFTIKGDTATRKLKLQLAPKSFKNAQKLFLQTNINGIATVIVYSKQKEALVKKNIPFKFKIGSIAQYNLIYLLAFIVVLLPIIVIILKKKKELVPFNKF